MSFPRIAKPFTVRCLALYQWHLIGGEFQQPAKDLGSAAPNNNKVGEGAKVKRKAPDAFVAALIRLLVEISRQAALSGKTFDVRAMPGQKADFYKLVARFDADLRCNSADTFSTYLKGLCQFVQ